MLPTILNNNSTNAPAGGDVSRDFTTNKTYINHNGISIAINLQSAHVSVFGIADSDIRAPNTMASSSAPPTTPDIHPTDARIIATVEQLLRDEAEALNNRDFENWADKFFDPCFAARLPHPMPDISRDGEAWVNYLKMLCEKCPDYKCTMLDFATTINDRRDKAECFANWQFEGIYAGVTVKVLGLYTFRKTHGKWRISGYSGYDASG